MLFGFTQLQTISMNSIRSESQPQYKDMPLQDQMEIVQINVLIKTNKQKNAKEVEMIIGALDKGKS